MDMTEERLETVLDSYGAAPERWPAEDRAAALALLARSDAARRRWVEAAGLDAIMQPAAAPQPSAALAERIKALPVERAAPRRRPWGLATLLMPLAPLRMPVAGAFAGVAVAFLAGLAVPSPFGGVAPAPATLALVSPQEERDLPETAVSELAVVDAISDEDASAAQTGGDAVEDEDLDLALLDLELE